MFLVITRGPNESVVIFTHDERIEVIVDRKVKLAIKAEKDVLILRGELED